MAAIEFARNELHIEEVLKAPINNLFIWTLLN